MNEEEPIKLKLGCRFCNCTFSIFEMKKYIDHLYRFHFDEAYKLISNIHEEISRIENLPK